MIIQFEISDTLYSIIKERLNNKISCKLEIIIKSKSILKEETDSETGKRKVKFAPETGQRISKLG